MALRCLVFVPGGTLVLWLLAPRGQLGYDAMYQLAWGIDLAHGRAPQLDLPVAPTPHPLQVLAAVPPSVLGAAADDAVRVLSLASLVVAAAGLGLAGARLASVPVGVAAGALLVTRPQLVELAHRGDADVPALAFVTWAGAVALGERRRREARALALLAAAGLLRPEPWLLAVVYAAWVAWGRAAAGSRVRVLALAAAGPLLWAAFDLLVAGDALWSYTHTEAGTELLARETGLPAAVRLLPRHLNFLLNPAVLAAGAAGGVVAALLLRRRAAPLIAAGGAAVAGWLVLGVAGLSLQPRYVVTIAALVALAAALGALGWTAPGSDGGGRRRAAWRRAGLAGGALVVAATLVVDVPEHRDVRAALGDDGRRLEQLVRGPARPVLRRCRPVQLPSVRALPHVAVWAGLRPGDLVPVGADGARPRGALVTPTPEADAGLAGRPPLVTAPAEGMRVVAGDRAWRVLARAC